MGDPGCACSVPDIPTSYRPFLGLCPALRGWGCRGLGGVPISLSGGFVVVTVFWYPKTQFEILASEVGGELWRGLQGRDAPSCVWLKPRTEGEPHRPLGGGQADLGAPRLLPAVSRSGGLTLSFSGFIQEIRKPYKNWTLC